MITPPRDHISEPYIARDLTPPSPEEDFYTPVEQLDRARWAEE